MPQMPRKMCKFAFAVQDAEGTAALQAAQIALPAPASENIALSPHYTFLRYADGKAYESSYFEAGVWAEGDVRVPLIPGCCVDLFDWIITRDGNWQGKWGTIWVDLGGRARKKFFDAKVVTARFTFRRASLAECVLTVRAKRTAVTEAITAEMPTTFEYSPKEIDFYADWTGATQASDKTLRELTVEVDNTVEGGEDGMRIATQTYPVSLDNEMGPVVTGTLGRDFTSSALYDAFIGQNEGSLRVVLERGATAATIEMERVVWVEHPLGIPDSGYVAEGVNYQALGSLDGTVAPITIEENS